MNAPVPPVDLLERLREAGAAHLDAVGWHYIEVLAERTRVQSGPAQTVLQEKLASALQAFEQSMATKQAQPPALSTASTVPSPLAALLQEMAPTVQVGQRSTASTPFGQQHESPRVRQFRKQLRQISVQKRVSNAIAQAPQNAGPINSHMLVLRALEWMRKVSPDYLNRFMTHVDTLLCLQASERLRQTAPKNTAQRHKK